MTQAEYRAVDLFCGSGAVSAALVQSNFQVLAALDNDPVACRTYRLNHPNVPLIEEDIRLVDPRMHQALASLVDIHLLIVCAPCQPFSSQNKKRGATDLRANLLLQSIKFAKTLQPACIFFENVPGIASATNRKLMDTLRSGLDDAGYTLGEPRRIDAAQMGVPQRRIRCVMVATRNPEAAQLFNLAKFEVPRTTVRQAIGHLPPLGSGEKSDDDLHFARVHSDLVLRRLAHIPKDGGSRSSLPAELELNCHRGRTQSFSDVYGRMKWDDVSPTLTTGCADLTRGRFAHPEQDRAVTLREASLLQTFPPGYRFSGSASDISRQIGNAVPVAMVTNLLPAIIQILEHPTRHVPNQAIISQASGDAGSLWRLA
ncbi:DNA cytosine methyltransferase [Agrobacterium vitis]|uniref:DNA cytosine methyltransferase n=1 Tax=Agrobacterium vitis TaxID=373 RepID=UPI001F3DF20A|nr:DNA cytosine methyltransferase [Agrobacterium vitis]MCF1478333.1 DNA cytosine methyltransferase [Agrobacterium vitis]